MENFEDGCCPKCGQPNNNAEEGLCYQCQVEAMEYWKDVSDEYRLEGRPDLP